MAIPASILSCFSTENAALRRMRLGFPFIRRSHSHRRVRLGRGLRFGESRLSLLVAVVLVLAALDTTSPIPSHASTALVQEHTNTSSSGSSITCAYSSTVTSGDELVLAFSTTTLSASVSSISDTRGNTFIKSVSTSGSGASSNQIGWIYTASTGSTGSDTITVTFAASANLVLVDCLEYSGVTNHLNFVRVASGTTSSGAVFGAFINPYNPQSGDLVFAYSAFTACGGTSQVNYDAMLTSGSGLTSGLSTGSNCEVLPTVKFSVNQADEWSTSVGEFSVSAGFGVKEDKSVGVVGTQGWLEMVVELGSSPPSPVPEPLSLDGACQNTKSTAATSISCSISTQSAYTVFVASLDLYTATAVTASVSDSVCGSWTQRYPSSGSSTDFLFYCKSPGIVSSDSVTASFSSNKATLVVYAIAGSNYVSPWDSNGALPAVASGTSASPSSSVSTSGKYDFVISQVRTGGAPTVTLQKGFISLGSGSTSNGVVQDSYSVVTTGLSSFTDGVTLGSSQSWASIGDAIVGTPTTSAPDSPATFYLTGDATMTRQSSQEKTFQAQGQFWYFTYDGSGFACQTSNNGQQFSSKYYIYKGSGQGGQMEVKYNSTTNILYVAVTNGSQVEAPWQFDAGTLPTSNPTCGGINWTLFQKNIDLTMYAVTSPSIYWDTSGHVWAGFQGNLTKKFGFEVWECTTALSSCGVDASWTRRLQVGTDKPYAVGTGYESQMGEFTAGKMWFMYGAIGNVSAPLPITIYTWSGTAFNTPKNTTGAYGYSGPNSGRGINLGDTLHIYTPDSNGTSGVGGNIKDISCSYPCSTITENTVYNQPTVLIVSAATDGSSRIVLTFAFANQSTISYMTSSDSGSTWNGPFSVATDFGVSDTSLTTDFSYAHDGNVSLIYTDNVGAPTSAASVNQCQTPCGVRVFYFTSTA